MTAAAKEYHPVYRRWVDMKEAANRREIMRKMKDLMGELTLEEKQALNMVDLQNLGGAPAAFASIPANLPVQPVVDGMRFVF